MMIVYGADDSLHRSHVVYSGPAGIRKIIGSEASGPLKNV